MPHGSHSHSLSTYTPLPLFVDMEGKKTLVVGGGCVAQRKIETLVNHGCDITVVSPNATERISRLASEGAIRLCLRLFEDADANDRFLVFACTDDASTNQRICDAAHRAGALVNCIDSETPEVSVPATMQRGDLQIAVSTAGASPALARKIRCELEDHFDPEYGRYVRLIGATRKLILDRVENPKLRHALNRELVDDKYRDLIMNDTDITPNLLLETMLDTAGERVES